MRPSGTNLAIFVIAGLAAIATFVMTAEADNQAADLATVEYSGERAEAVFAGGCFWCIEADFDKVAGVIETTSGYTGGALENPTYKQVSYTETGHFEALKVVYDPQAVTYAELVEYFWRHIDPTDGGGQFCDRGTSYLTGIFPANDEQAEIAQSSLETLEGSGVLANPIKTVIKPLTVFWPAEEYHQDYYKKNPIHYSRYRRGCGRDARVADVWAGEVVATEASANAHGS
jgi:methionine-S-sulfoxide reductase